MRFNELGKIGDYAAASTVRAARSSDGLWPSTSMMTIPIMRRLARKVRPAKSSPGQLRNCPKMLGPKNPPRVPIELMAARAAANRPLCALSEAQEIRVRFNGELPAGRAEVL
jgi:hypothetical protein